ncbi:MAG TPA: hypothetical protein VGM63_24885 [Mucilaginibacter sp.]
MLDEVGYGELDLDAAGGVYNPFGNKVTDGDGLAWLQLAADERRHQDGDLGIGRFITESIIVIAAVLVAFALDVDAF